MPTAQQRAVFPHIVGEAIRASGMSQVQVAKAIGKASQTVNGYVTGKIVPPPDVCAALEQALGLQPDGLAGQLGYAPPSGNTVTPEAAVELDESLSEETTQFILGGLDRVRRWRSGR